MEIKTTYKDGYRQDYWRLDDGTTGTTNAQFIMNTVRELCHKAGLDEEESGVYELAVYRTIQNDLHLDSLDTLVEGQWE